MIFHNVFFDCGAQDAQPEHVILTFLRRNNCVGCTRKRFNPRLHRICPLGCCYCLLCLQAFAQRMCCSRYGAVLVLCLVFLIALGSALFVFSVGVSEYDAQLGTRILTSGRMSHPWMCGQCFESQNHQHICEQCDKGRRTQALGMREQSLELAAIRASEWSPDAYHEVIQKGMYLCLELIARNYAHFMQGTLGLFWALCAFGILNHIVAPRHRNWLDSRQSMKRKKLIEERSATHATKFAHQMHHSNVQENEDLPRRPSYDFHSQPHQPPLSTMHAPHFGREPILMHRRPSASVVAAPPV